MNPKDQDLGKHTTALLGKNNGKYPDANALLIQGAERTMLVDAPLGVLPRLGTLPEIDLVVLSHCHEDHLPTLRDFPEAECWVHQDDLLGLTSLDDFLDLFGMPEPRRSQWRDTVVERFRYQARPGARAFTGGHVWDLGGVTVTAHHTPGHTRGHCVLEVQPDDVLFLGDIDLSGFGPYYGDAWSDLEAFERTLESARGYRARHYLSGHHIGLLDHDGYQARLERYIERIREREKSLIEYLSEPRTLEEIVEHRFVYRPQDDVPGADSIERRSMSQHLERLIRDRKVRKQDDRFAVTQ